LIINSHQQQFYFFQSALMRKPLLRLLSSTTSSWKVAVWISSITQAPRYVLSFTIPAETILAVRKRTSDAFLPFRLTIIRDSIQQSHLWIHDS
jgi:hypothetical protein